LFSDDSLISLDEWVFNTEAHPLPIKGVNAFYREASAKNNGGSFDGRQVAAKKLAFEESPAGMMP